MTLILVHADMDMDRHASDPTLWTYEGLMRRNINLLIWRSVAVYYTARRSYHKPSSLYM
ncbi:hypothetical protein BJY04DRAFT_189518 [Aspergillus karnatakaensis]|uniref:uncharacterized protein n=1 Tax=Aspergillus karnatakaensis TaxID=1810916 RepID=UPI003CCDD063